MVTRYLSPLRWGLPVLIALSVITLGLQGCSTQSKLAMEPSTTTYHDVFTCKGLTADEKWVGVTDVFDPETDSYVVVVAQLDAEDKNKTINYEFVNPNNSVVISENRSYPKANPLGIYFSMQRLIALGGEGEWKANVYSNGAPVGQQVFYLGKKQDALDDIPSGPTYYVVGGESDESTKTNSLEVSSPAGGIVREATPELSIPTPSEPEDDPNSSL